MSVGGLPGKRSRRRGGGGGANKALTSSQQLRGTVTSFPPHWDGPAHLFTWAVGPSKTLFTITGRRNKKRATDAERGGSLDTVISTNLALDQR
ncbi:hypothetical protein R3I93_006988 [Phoxinus phoxinus]|uniref:Uncharacterized protein n=1 Tax=Phoxinus phoxinus TaxID=58324 RepID=A0AAN9H9T1_9TELE